MEPARFPCRSDIFSERHHVSALKNCRREYRSPARVSRRNLTTADWSLASIEDAALCLVASPEYMAQAGIPDNLADPERHICLPFMLPSSDRIAP